MKEILDSINEEIKDKDIILVAVSKTKSNEAIMEAYNFGVRDFGENYVQELIGKMDTLPDDINWHMIGHLQTNKVKDLIKRNIYLIESVDSVKLANEINKQASKLDKVVNILLEVNIAHEDTKTGIILEDVPVIISEVHKLSNINLLGLMAIAPHTDDETIIRQAYKDMVELRDKYGFKLLSMGMTNDYKIGIEEGTNIIRIGTKIFGKR